MTTGASTDPTADDDGPWQELGAEYTDTAIIRWHRRGGYIRQRSTRWNPVSGETFSQRTIYYEDD